MNRSTQFKLAAVAAIGVACAFRFPALHGQTLVLEEVVVTAQQREQSLQDVPVAVSTMSGEQIAENGIVDLQEVTQHIPNVSINRGAQQPNIFIRGVGSGTNAGFEQSVGMYVDGVYSGRGQLASMPMTMDLQRIEILKGPQGILFGKNTIGGAISITSARPSQEFEAMIDTLYAPTDGEHLSNAMLNGPMTETLSGRIAVRHEEMDGWWDNTLIGEDGSDRSNTFARGSLLWEVSENLEILAKLEHGDFNESHAPAVIYQSDFAGMSNFQGDVPFPVISDLDEGALDQTASRDARVDTYALTVNWALDFATVTSISAYSGYDVSQIEDADFSAVPALHRGLDEDYDQYSQELRLVSPGGETVDWILGAYYQQSDLAVSRTNEQLDLALLGPLSVPELVNLSGQPIVPSVFDQNSNSWAIFGQGTWAVSDTTRLGLGLRYNDETKKLDKVMTNNAGARAASLGSPNLIVYSDPANSRSISDLRSHSFTGLKRDEDEVTWMSNVQWDANDNSMLYASVSTGFKGGGYDEAYSGAGETVRLVNFLTGAGIDSNGDGMTDTDPTASADASILEYDNETVLAYEAGAKLTLLNGAAELNIAVFRMEYDDLQVSALVGDVFRVTNAGDATSQGVEVDGRWLVAQGLTLGGAVAYLDADYGDFTNAPCTVAQAQNPGTNPGCLDSEGNNITAPATESNGGGQDLSGETLLFAPDWSANFNVNYMLPLTDYLMLGTTLDINYTSSFYSALDLDPNTKHEGYTKVNLRIGIGSADEKWSVAIVGKNLTDVDARVWNNDVPTTNSGSYFGVPERSRSVAIQGRYHIY